MHLDMIYHLEKPKRVIIWDGENTYDCSSPMRKQTKTITYYEEILYIINQ